MISKLAFEYIADAAFAYNAADGRIVEANKQACDSLGYEKDELLNLSVFDIEQLALSPEEWNNHVEKLKERGAADLDGIHQRKDGSFFPVELSVSFVESDGKSLVFAVARDISKRRILERALFDERNKLKAAIDALGFGISIRDRDYNILYQAGKSMDIFGDKRGKKCYREYEGLNAPCDDCPVDKTFKDGMSHVSIRNVEIPGGREMFVQNTTSPIYDDRGEIYACMEIVNDVTEQKIIESVLIENQNNMRTERAQFLALFDGIEDLLYVSDIENYEILYANDTFEKMFGKGKIGHLCYAVLQNRSEPCPFCTNDIITGEGFGKSYVWEKQNEVNGRWYRCADKAIKWTDGRLVRFEIATDITPMKQAEENALQNEFWMKQSQRVARVGSYVLDVKAGTWTCSEVLDEIFGIDEGFDRSVSGWLEIVYEDDRQAMQDYLQSEVLGKGNNFDREYRIKRISDGAVRWVSGQGELVHEDGVPIIMLGCIRDITEQKDTEHAREELYRQLVQSQKMDAVGHLAGGMAHDFNNLLGIITGCAQMAKGELTDENEGAQKELDVLLGVVQRAKDITMNLLTFARKGNIQLQDVTTKDLLNDLYMILERSIDKNIIIEIENECPDFLLTADRNQVVQALLNICINAADAMKTGGTMTIRADQALPGDQKCKKTSDKKGECCVISITDTGHGIKESDIHRIMEPFFTTKEMGKGTGLGLSVSHGIIKNHNGKIEVQSEEGKGTTMNVYLPISGRIEKKTEDKRAGANGALRGDETILVVDDEELLLKVTERQLKKLGYNPIALTDASEALNVFESKSDEIDMVILDYMMPKTNAYNVFKKLKEINSDVRVVVISGFSEESNLKKILAEGAVGFVQKPFEINELCETIRHAMEA